MYNKNLAVAIKVNGRVLREYGDQVYMPFGSEYSILIKNLNSVRVLANITIDGDDVAPNGLVIGAGQELDLERSIKNGNLSVGNRFKFIERTGDIENHRGIGVEDGLIRVEYSFERPVIRTPWINSGFNTYYDKFQKYSNNVNNTNITTRSLGSAISYSADASSTYNDTGITVPGGRSDQKFQTVSSFPTEDQSHVIILKLLGETANNQPIREPLTVKSKPKCTSCGHTNKASAKFCNKCGTALEIYA